MSLLHWLAHLLHINWCTGVIKHVEVCDGKAASVYGVRCSTCGREEWFE